LGHGFNRAAPERTGADPHPALFGRLKRAESMHSLS
jgi:hypothetical protein